ncbi:MAG: hypothetical protein E7489_01345 [Ruminococcaceae bacterium]|nr:hypothetical protein [Oscillospiraceae bacterium]
MKVLFEDKFIIVAEKPADVLSEPSAEGKDIVTMAEEHVHKPCYLVHRLDRNTGGAMVLSKCKRPPVSFPRLFKNANLKKNISP